MEKAPDAFRTISEVAEELNVPQHVLRFWESRFREIKPMKRGGGRRYYRPEDVHLLRGIRHLLYGEGYTIRGVQRILKEQGGKFVQAVWQAGAPQPGHRPGDDDPDFAPDEAEVAQEPAHRAQEETERGRGLLALLPSLLGDSDESEELADGRNVPLLGSPELPAVATTRPQPVRTPAPRPMAGLAREDLRKLQSALHELGECRKLLETALSPSP